MNALLDSFLDFSAEMTCFKRFELLGTGQTEAYARTAQDAAGDAFQALLAIHRALPPGPGRLVAIRTTILGDEFVGPVARAIIKMWYIGIWYEMPQGWTEKYGARGRNTSFMVTPSAYAEGLLWPAIGAHPPGAKAPGYGSWALAPTIPTFTCALAAAGAGSGGGGGSGDGGGGGSGGGGGGSGGGGGGPMLTQTEEGHVTPHHVPKDQHPPPPPGGYPR